MPAYQPDVRVYFFLSEILWRHAQAARHTTCSEPALLRLHPANLANFSTSKLIDVVLELINHLGQNGLRKLQHHLPALVRRPSGICCKGY